MAYSFEISEPMFHDRVQCVPGRLGAPSAWTRLDSARPAAAMPRELLPARLRCSALIAVSFVTQDLSVGCLTSEPADERGFSVDGR